MTYFNDVVTKRNWNFLTGNEVTLADVACIANITFLEVIDFDFEEFPKTKEWVERVKALNFYKECSDGFEQRKKDMKSKDYMEKMKARQEFWRRFQQQENDNGL